MQHFVKDDKLNIFRLPVGWQYLVPSPGAPLSSTNFPEYDKLVRACLKTGAQCIIDLHNYGRWNGGLVGQGGPSNAEFANLWGQLAKTYAAEPGVVMGLMNEPHDIGDTGAWAQTIQAAVTAIRSAGATSNMILLPGMLTLFDPIPHPSLSHLTHLPSSCVFCFPNTHTQREGEMKREKEREQKVILNNYSTGTEWTSAGSMVTSGSAAALASVHNLDGGTTNLIYDMHNYFDASNGGVTSECVSNKIAAGFTPPLAWMRSNKRQAFVSELGGGGNAQSCVTDICAALDFLNENSDVYLGWTAWSAGAFPANYPLNVLEPSGEDTPLMKQCFAGKFNGGAGLGNATATTGTATTPAGDGIGLIQSNVPINQAGGGGSVPPVAGGGGSSVSTPASSTGSTSGGSGSSGAGGSGSIVPIAAGSTAPYSNGTSSLPLTFKRPTTGPATFLSKQNSTTNTNGQTCKRGTKAKRGRKSRKARRGVESSSSGGNGNVN